MPKPTLTLKNSADVQRVRDNTYAHHDMADLSFVGDYCGLVWVWRDKTCWVLELEGIKF